MKVNKYLTDKNKSNLKSRLQSYGTMAAAFMVAGGAYAQCGTADAANPALDIDIDGDGTADVTLNWVAGTPATATFTSTVPGAASTNLFNSQIGTLSTSLYVGGNFSYYGCQPAYIPAYYGYGFGGGAFFQGDPAWGSYTFVNATAPIYYQINAIGVFNYYFTFASGLVNYASAVGAGSNQIVGLTAAGSSVCAAIDSAPGVAGPNNVSLGSAGSTYFYYFSVAAANSLQYAIPAATASIPTPASTCFTFSYSIFGLYLPPVPVPISTAISASSFVTVGPFAIGSGVTGTGAGTLQNTNPTTYLGVQFVSGGETHNGWVQISIDPATSAITCVGTGYQECSLETAAGVGVPSGGCINTGDATTQSALCEGDVPTVGEWGLIMLGLLMSITAIVGIRQRKEEEVVA